MYAFKNSVTRLSRYKSALKRLKSVGVVKVFSDNLADAAGVNPAQVRKDFSVFGISGNKKGGYQIDELLAEIETLLCKDKVQPVILVGNGNIGNALLNYTGFEKENIKIVAAFDADDNKLNSEATVPIYSVDEMESFIRENQIKLAILAVPALAAQETLDLLVSAGIKGVMNFSPISLRAPDDIYINHVDLEMELETVIFYVFSNANAEGPQRG